MTNYELMTNDELIKCGCWFTDTGMLVTDDIDLQAFAKLVAEREREACAKVADSHMDGTPEWNSAANNIAAAIRARGNYQKGQTD